MLEPSPKLALRLIGSPEILLDGAPVDPHSVKATALLAVLACSKKTMRRESLSALLWCDATSKQAHAALRTTLWRLRSTGLGDWLDTQHGSVSFRREASLSVDVDQFHALMAQCTQHGHPANQVCPQCLEPLAEAVNLCHGDFMAGFSLRDSQNFNDWIAQQNLLLRNELTGVLSRLAGGHQLFGDQQLAIQYTLRLLSLDNLNEEVHLQLLRLYGNANQRSAVITHFSDYKRLLKREMGVEPAKEITALYKSILAGKGIDGRIDSSVQNPIFLVMDIVNAAALWGHYGDQMGAYLNRYHNIVKDATSRYGGRVIQQSNDALTILFDKVQPYNCVLAINRLIQRSNWDPIGKPSIRMAMNSSPWQKASIEEYSEVVYIANRLLAVAWGGQIIITAETLSLLELPVRGSVVDLGIHMLENLPDPFHLYDLQHPDIPSETHPPIRTVKRQVHNFPTQLSSFIGREKELETIIDLLEQPEYRLLTVTGVGGVGKSRLAIQAAIQLLEKFPDGVFFIPLASLTSSDLIPNAIAHALNYTFYSMGDLTQQLAGYMRDKRLLLVIDNFEHLMQATGLLSALIAQTHAPKFLVTTRERLNLHSEVVFEVRGMPYPVEKDVDDIEQYGAGKLFLQNARRVHPGFNLQREDRLHLLRICQLVEGLPLGIELASAWVRAFTCQEIASEIERNLSFLISSAIDTPVRHRSLQAVFDHSYDLLAGDTRRILSRLAVFRGGFTSEAAHQVANASPIVLAAVVDRSMLRRQTDGRFEMPETLRPCWQEILERNPKEFASTQIRHCEYYSKHLADSIENLHGFAQLTASSMIQKEMANIHVAWNYALLKNHWKMIEAMVHAIYVYHSIHSKYQEGRAFLQQALERIQRQPNPQLEFLSALLTLYYGWFSFRLGYHNSGIPEIDRSILHFSEMNLPLWVSIARIFKAEIHRQLSNYPEAMNNILPALAYIENQQLPQINSIRVAHASALGVLGAIRLRTGEHTQAKRDIQLCMQIYRQIGNRSAMIQPLIDLAKISGAGGDPQEGKDLLQEALDISMTYNDVRSIAAIYNNLGALYNDAKNHTEGLACLKKAIVYAQEVGDRWLTAIIYNNIGHTYLSYFDDFQESIHNYHKSIDIFTSIQDKLGVGFTSYDISKAYLRAGLLEQARLSITQALQIASTSEHAELAIRGLHGYAMLQTSLEKPEQALAYCDLILTHPQTDDYIREETHALLAQIETRLPPQEIQSLRSNPPYTELRQAIADII